VAEHRAIYAWVGYYQTFAESVTNEACRVSVANRNVVWDLAVGSEATWQDYKSRANVVVGARVDDANGLMEDGSSRTNVFYREGYLRYESLISLGGPYSLELQGWHRWRKQTVGGPGEAWFEGQHLTGIQWAPHFAGALGLEYNTNPQTAPTYVNVQLS